VQQVPVMCTTLAVLAAAAAACAAWMAGFLQSGKNDSTRREGRVEFDYVVIGGGPSGCYLARLLAERFPSRSVCVINRDGDPPKLWKTYFINLVGVAIPSLVPSFAYRLRSHKRQFANSTYIGGNTNINAAVGPVPSLCEFAECVGSALAEHYEDFVKGPEIRRVSRDCRSEAGLERLSKDLNELGVPGSRIRVFSDGMKRIHPVDFIKKQKNISVVVAHADCLRLHPDTKAVQSVMCDGGKLEIVSRNRTFLCAGALESPKLLIRSGVGPKHLVEGVGRKGGSINKSITPPVLVENEHIGSNLQDHWVGRASAKVPDAYTYATLYPHILGYKHQFKDVAMGFGKLQLLGKNLMSFATTRCKNPGSLVLTADGDLEPYLPIGVDDMNAYHESLEELIRKLAVLGIRVKPKVGPLSPNWHLSCTLSIGTCVDETTLEVKGVPGLHVADVSILRNISPMNTQMLSYAIPFALVEQLGSELAKSAE